MALDVVQPGRLAITGKTWDFSAGTLRCATPIGSTDVVNKDYLSSNILSLDQTTPQTVENGAPIFMQGLSGRAEAGGVALAGYAYATGATEGYGVFGEGFVVSTADTAISQGVYGRAIQAHAGGTNIGVRGTAWYGDGNRAGYFAARYGITSNHGVYCQAYTYGTAYARAVYGLAAVEATGDTGIAYGGYFASSSTHAGGNNIAVYATASNGAANYSFYGNAGNVYLNGNVGIGSTSFNATGTKTLLISNGTAPNAAVADCIEIYAKDTSDSKSTLAIFTEQAVEDIGTFTASHKLKIIINGTAYWIQLDAV